MEDFPMDEEDPSLPLSPSLASDFNELYTVNPPSPILTPSQVAFTWSSGEIPVLLYDEAYAEGGMSISDIASPTGSTRTVAVGGRRDSSVSVSTAVGLRSGFRLSLNGLGLDRAILKSSTVPRSVRSSRVDSALLGLESSDSSNTITSVGTFGPKRKTLIIKPHELESEISTLVPVPQSPPPAPPALPVTPGKRVSLVDGEFAIQRRRSGSVVQVVSPTILGNIERSCQEVVKNDAAHGLEHQGHPQSGKLSIAGGQECEFDVSDIGLLTPKKPLPTNISWISSRDWDSNQYKEFVAREDLARRLSVPYTPDFNEDVTVTPPRRTPVRPRVLENRDLNVIVETPRASQFPPSLHESPRPQEAPTEDKSNLEGHHSQRPRHVHHDDHSWLKGVTVQFLIDQEGFRAAQPSFKFTGVARLRSAQSSRAPGTVMAQFRPVTRQAFHFHYAPFETPPILRRVTVDFDESHDYLSKQAHLTLKANGVYVLHGHEMLFAGHETDSSKLHWQFEYLVDDRRIEGSGRIIEGEKILTPLNFSCSPFLVLPKQGKRNTIMHVFRKGVATKLISEKLQPPGATPPIPTKAGNTGGVVNCAEADGHISHFFSSKAHAWNFHKRGQSHAAPTAVDAPSSSNHRANQSHSHWPTISNRHLGEEHSRTEFQSVRRRRASSTGEHHRPSNKLNCNTSIHSGRPRDISTADPHMFTPPNRKPNRHIIPPAKLAELLDTPTSPTELTAQSATPPRISAAFVPLTPRPRHTSHIRDPSRTR
ncbi:hypothetical protein GALMADRAFT_132430 [Galerina marginata CBS 339.88]|uniref:Uncharacterized protein n=1 Tax=Galerina marginata (strain CBS 339.88) TaxID=685588 RepID=A0A067TRF5_GALM3|nr:hypothetical protein GALMADRAFT_132430 [Galerina marginata CBS 339.88]